jgi:hypothetical protein
MKRLEGRRKGIVAGVKRKKICGGIYIYVFFKEEVPAGKTKAHSFPNKEASYCTESNLDTISTMAEGFDVDAPTLSRYVMQNTKDHEREFIYFVSTDTYYLPFVFLH